MATEIDGVTIDAITLSPVQAGLARERVEASGLSERIRVNLGDYHHVPFPPESFDVVLFLESVGYAIDQRALFAEMWRVLRPGGTVYVKDAFVHDRVLSADEEAALADMNSIFAVRFPYARDLSAAMANAGFVDITFSDLSAIIDTSLFSRAVHVWDEHGAPVELTPFGVRHTRQTAGPPPIDFGTLKAWKPVGDGGAS
jgi:cyclopropane fatty-acyl-phospholipid synthase-like methyltransferase